LDRQTATSEVLGIISSSLGELEPVFQTVLANATRICEANFGILYSYENEKFRTVAMLGAPPAFAEWLQREPRYWDPSTALGRMVQSKQAVNITDVYFLESGGNEISLRFRCPDCAAGSVTVTKSGSVECDHAVFLRGQINQPAALKVLDHAPVAMNASRFGRMRESRTYGSGRGACDETYVPTATPARVHYAARRSAENTAKKQPRLCRCRPPSTTYESTNNA
jgi:hypothetical protein